jgi:hypothetical protein
MEAVAACREHLIAMPPPPPIRSQKRLKRGTKPGKPLGFRWTESPCKDEEEKKNSLKMSDQYRNVYENKEPTFRELGQSGNLIENKGSYALEAGMSLKTSVLAAACGPF